MWNKNYFYLINTLLIFSFSYSLQEGTLVLKNGTAIPAALRLESLLDSGNIQGVHWIDTSKKVIMPSADPNQWTPLNPEQEIVIDTPIKISSEMGGVGSLWGSTTQVYVLNRQTNKANLFVLNKIAAYTLMIKKINAQDTFVLRAHDDTEINPE